ncbi:pyrroline-5-carboxylate reductase isoform X2 [Hyalella azteca]|uniref:Pyrroline-5-carboxylate reductase n=1 Tax=Hyalella azteca TaxID=294128 RepID=A0A8B7P1A7_HYAAZ|nr:pyrroline-5-carboxylate reductase isoform X2 [Hyalella azteca]
MEVLSSNKEKLKIGFIGAGNMASAIIAALLKKGAVAPEQLIVSARTDTRLAELRQRGIATTTDNVALLKQCSDGVVFLCVKPHVWPAIAPALMYGGRRALFISVMAGVSIQKLSQAFGERIDLFSLVRAMPNTPARVGEGCCVYAVESVLSAERKALAAALLGCLGLVREVPEQQIDAVTALAGSGPAYIYVAIEALADGAVKMGLPRDLALALAAQTVRGAATMVQETGKHPAQLKDEVCSPGGTTIAGIHKLEEHGFRNALICAVEGAALRAKELGQE